MRKNTDNRRRVSCSERVSSWLDIHDAIREAMTVFGMAAHDDRDNSSRNKIWKLLDRASVIANAESSYCQMEDYNGCFIIPKTLAGV